MSMNLKCNLMPLEQTPTDVTWKLMSAADPQAKGNISEATGRSALNVLEAYATWRTAELQPLEEAMWYNQSWALGYLTPEMWKDEQKRSLPFLSLNTLRRRIERCRKNVESLKVWVV